jgi:hypothetical protein
MKYLMEKQLARATPNSIFTFEFDSELQIHTDTSRCHFLPAEGVIIQLAPSATHPQGYEYKVPNNSLRWLRATTPVHARPPWELSGGAAQMQELMGQSGAGEYTVGFVLTARIPAAQFASQPQAIGPHGLSVQTDDGARVDIPWGSLRKISQAF